MISRAHTPLARRGLSALLVVLYLVAALGAARHAGEHEVSGADWLPERFHHHVYVLSDGEGDAPVHFQEMCAACQWSRTGQRLVSRTIAGPAPGSILRVDPIRRAPDASGGGFLLPDSRGPPSA